MVARFVPGISRECLRVSVMSSATSSRMHMHACNVDVDIRRKFDRRDQLLEQCYL